MRGLLALCFFCILMDGCGSSADVVVDCYSVQRYKRLTQPSFDLYMMNVRADNGSRLDLYVQMPFDHLRFVKTDSGYSAAYTVVFIFRDDNGDAVVSKEVSRTVAAPTYEASVSKNADAFLQSVILAPGQYRIESNAVDQNSLVKFSARNVINVFNFAADSVMASTMLLLVKPPGSDAATVLHPLFPQSIRTARDSLGIFQEVYGVGSGDTISVAMKYLTSIAANKRVAHSGNTMVPPYSRYLGSCMREPDSAAYASRMIFTADRAGTLSLIHFYPVPPTGYSELVRTVGVTRAGKTDSFVAHLFLFKPVSVGPTVAEISDAMRFITREDEFDSLQNRPDSVRSVFIDRFWAEHGGTARRAEFVHRMDDANKLFTVCTEGSRTPMGIVYIICGPPDGVECRGPFTETWYYSVGNQTLTVPFRLERRNEEGAFYELPLNSVDDLLWQSFVDQWRRH
jgi:GWxTD domain-containing protein